jgi:hypothetical protein
MKILLRLADIPDHAKIGIFGAGQAGSNILEILRRFRPDLQMAGYIDNFATG